MVWKQKLDKNVFATLLMVLCIGAFFVFASVRVNQQATEACFASLDDTAAQVAADLSAIVQANEVQLDVVADLLAQHEDDSPDIVQKHLLAYQQRGTLTTIGLYMPDGRMFTGLGQVELPDTLDFQQEVSRAPYISGVVSPRGNTENKLFYHVVPVERNGETVALLYGFVDLKAFAERLTVTAFEGNAQIYVADGETGDFLVDTWHDTLGNIFDTDIMSRKVKPGYDYLQMKQDFVDGKAGHIAFFSQSAGEYFYSYYMPVGVNHWMVQLTVPESVAFARAIQIRTLLYFVAVLEIVSLTIYFLWVLSNVRRKTQEKEAQLAQFQYMYSVQQALFDAHKQPALLSSALQQVAQMVKAKDAFFTVLDGDTAVAFYSSGNELSLHPILPETSSKGLFLQAFQQLRSGISMVLNEADLRLLTTPAEQKMLDESNIRSLMLAPVLNTEEALAGILGCCNMERLPADCTLLECVSRNFLMAQSNVSFYQQIKQMGMIDAPTGLRNRNCYESVVEAFQQVPPVSLGFLYLDANGLHEINNTLGHAAGDAMLLCIADSLKTLFLTENCYRIGGDEFAVFCPGLNRDQVAQRVEKLNARLKEFGYRVSIGEAWLEDCIDCKEMISLAESRMYEAKRLYYQQSGDETRARLMNRKLERTLLEKKDSDAFLKIISTRFMGVYVVDLQTDLARVIYKPSYFSAILEQNHDRFRPSMQSYCRTYVAEEDRNAFLAMLDYSSLRARLAKQEDMHLSYHRADGTPMALHIYAGADSGESIWVFETENQ